MWRAEKERASQAVITSAGTTAALDACPVRLLGLNGLSGGAPASARVYKLSDRTIHEDDAEISYRTSAGRDLVTYTGSVSVAAIPAARFVLRFLVQDDRLTITCEFDEECEGFELMGITVPLISASASAGGSLVIPSDGGRMVDVAASEPGEHLQRATCSEMPLVAMLRQGDTAALLELGSLDDNIISSVSEENGEKQAALSVKFTHRYGPRNLDIPTFKVTNRSESFITLFEPRGRHWWVEGAKILRRKVMTSIPPLYDGALVYKIKLDEPDFDETQYQTFDEGVDVVRRVSNYTAGGRQVAYLNGWQWHGHDTGYPDVFTVNERLGGIERFRQALKAGEQYNAVVSFHDNYDDAYIDSPAWEDEIIATDENGRPKTGGVWGGGQAYIISPHKYIDRARERIRRTVEMYGVGRSVHVDVFSVVPDRYDFDPDNPAGFARSTEAKNYILRAFRELGLDMTSEGICPAFVGSINYGWHFPDTDDVSFSAEEQIPLLPFIYHGRTIGAGGVDDDRHLLKHLLWGLTFSMDFRKDTAMADLMERYYLITVPYFQLASRTMQSYETDGDWLTVRYDGQSYVRVNYERNCYEVVVDGRAIATDFTVTSPLPQSGWVIYSREGGEVRMPLPDDVESVDVALLGEERPRPFADFSFANGTVRLNAEARRPYHITRRS